MVKTRSLCQLRFSQTGLVLVIVLWIIALLAIMAGGFAYSMRIETRLATSAVDRAQARALAEAGIAYALAWQLDPELPQQWPPNGDERDWTFGGARLRIRTIDASGLVNLNTAEPELLKALLAAAGLDARDQDRLAAAIQEQRNPTEQGKLDAGSHTAIQGMRSGPSRFESIEDLQQVPGMIPVIYAQLAGLVTVFSEHRGVNPELAPVPMLRALGLDERAAADYVETRTRAAVSGQPPPPLSAGGNPFLFSQGKASVYHVAAAAETATGATATIEAVIDGRRTAAGQLPRLLAWRDGH